MDFVDRINIDSARKTVDGEIVASARVARTGIQEYSGFEVGKPEVAKVRVWRPADEVFAAASMRTYPHAAVTIDHPADAVDPKNWKDLAVGYVGDEVVRDGDFIRVPLIVKDAGAVSAVDSGKRQLSMGYSAELEWSDGTTPDGQRYDAIQRNLRMNHVAIVAAARGGSQLKIGDAEEGDDPMNDKTRSITLDAIPITVPDQSAAVIDKAIADRDKRIADAKSEIDARDKKIADLEKALATRDAEIDSLKAKVVDGAALDAKVAERAKLVDTARRIDPKVVTDGKTDAEIKTAVVLARYGDKAKDKGEHYVAAAFDILADAAPAAGAGAAGGGMRDALSGIQPATVNVADAAYKKRVEAMRDAWKRPAA